MKLSCFQSVLLGTLLFLTCPANSETVGKRVPKTVEGKKSVPLKVIARPFAKIYKTKKVELGQVKRDNVAPFTVFYVYEKPPDSKEVADAWYEVGTDTVGTVVGFMQAKDVVPWKQTLCLAFDKPDGRQPVLMFKDRQPLEEVVALEGEQRSSRASTFYSTVEEIASGRKVPPGFPVISMEPKRFIDFQTQFYFLPILDYATVEIGDYEGRLLHIAACAEAAVGSDATTLTNKRAVQGMVQENDVRDASNAKVDVVYVLDLTRSMGPFVESTLEVCRAVSDALGKLPGMQERFRFGIWGYRDSEQIRGIEFNTRNYSQQLQPIDQFVRTLSTVKNTEVDSGDYEEDVFSGVLGAITETKWTPGAMRIVVLIGDAPGHELGHKWNKSGFDAERVRSEANNTKTVVYSVHIKDPKHSKYFERGEEHFKTLATNSNDASGGVAYIDVTSRDPRAFQQAANNLFDVLRKFLIEGGGAAKKPEANLPEIDTAAGRAVRAAIVQWIGEHQQVEPPNNISAWVTDKDLRDPSRQALEVNVLLTKNQLDTLDATLKMVMEAAASGRLTGRGFFNALQSVAGSAVSRPEAIANAKTFADTGLVPEFLKDLPYKSTIMALSEDEWASWSATQQEKFIITVRNMRNYYRALHDQPERWIALSEGADEGEKVFPVALKDLP